MTDEPDDLFDDGEDDDFSMEYTPEYVPEPVEEPPATAAFTESLRGRFLVAGPQLRDRNFFKTVILVLEHTAVGAMGLVINRPSSVTVRNALAGQIELRDNEDDVYIGGPVEPDHLFLIHHNLGWGEESIEVAPGVYVTTDPDAFKAIVTTKGPEPRRTVSGYAGWAPGQLEGELQAGDWLLTDAAIADVFGPDPYSLWDTLRGRINDEHRLIAGDTPHPEWN